MSICCIVNSAKFIYGDVKAKYCKHLMGIVAASGGNQLIGLVGVLLFT